VHIEDVGSIAHQAADQGELAPIVNYRNRMACRQRDDLFALTK
jgi:hypothetical protein